MQEKSLFQLKKVQKSLGAFTLAIHSLEVYEGEVLCLLGPTGAGKSTLLRLLAGLLESENGNLLFEGSSFESRALDLSTRRRMALVHQRPYLQTGTVRYNVEIGLRLRCRQNYGDKVDAILNRLGLTKIAMQSARTLSGGQMQLVALARALVIEPEVLFLDEPTAHLDPTYVALVEETIDKIRQERPITTVWATHNLFQARRVSSRTVLLLEGKIIEVAQTKVFFENPSDPRTVDFVQGRMVY